MGLRDASASKNHPVFSWSPSCDFSSSVSSLFSPHLNQCKYISEKRWIEVIGLGQDVSVRPQECVSPGQEGVTRVGAFGGGMRIWNSVSWVSEPGRVGGGSSSKDGCGWKVHNPKHMVPSKKSGPGWFILSWKVKRQFVLGCWQALWKDERVKWDKTQSCGPWPS